MHASVLRYLDQVARSKSIRRAAGELNVAASAVNRQILNLERDLGCDLFDRHSNGITPTPAGEVVLAHVRRTLTDWRSTVSGIGTLTGKIAGEVRILSIPPLIPGILASVVIELTEKHEDIAFSILESDQANTSSDEQMQIGFPDVALLPYDRRYHNYAILDTLTLKIGAVVSKDHPLAVRESVSFSECAAYPMVQLFDSWLESLADTEFRNTGLHYEPNIRSNSWMFVREMIRSGKGIGFFTPVGIMSEIQREELIFVPVEIPENVNSRLSIYVNKSRLGSSEIKVTLDSLQERFQDLRNLSERLLNPTARDHSAP